MNTFAQLKKGNCSRHGNFKHAMSSISQYIVIEQTDGSLPQVPYFFSYQTDLPHITRSVCLQEH